MTLDEAIKHCMDIAETQEMCSNGKKCAEEHRQLAEWLKDYKRQADTLDKIKAEIDRQQKWLLQAGYTMYNVDIAFDAIKAVVAESEDRE